MQFQRHGHVAVAVIDGAAATPLKRAPAGRTTAKPAAGKDLAEYGTALVDGDGDIAGSIMQPVRDLLGNRAGSSRSVAPAHEGFRTVFVISKLTLFFT